jgi:hypothetical protein
MLDPCEHQQLTDKIAALMRWGTAAGSLLTAAGLLLAATRSPWAAPVTVAAAGVFVALPVLRLLVMAAAYIRANDWLFSAITVGVLVLVGVSVTVGILVL